MAKGLVHLPKAGFAAQHALVIGSQLEGPRHRLRCKTATWQPALTFEMVVRLTTAGLWTTRSAPLLFRNCRQQHLNALAPARTARVNYFT